MLSRTKYIGVKTESILYYPAAKHCNMELSFLCLNILPETRRMH